MMRTDLKVGFVAVLAASLVAIPVLDARAGDHPDDGADDGESDCTTVDLGGHAESDCEIVGSAECHAGCDAWVDASCDAKVDAECGGACDVGASTTCLGECAASCTAECGLGIDLNLDAWCEDDCVAAAAAACGGGEDALACEADAALKCASSCDLALGVVGALQCNAGCDAACAASCDVAAEFSCALSCEADVKGACEAELDAQCHADCDAGGALVCEGELLDLDDVPDVCVVRLAGADAELPALDEDAVDDPKGEGEDSGTAVGCTVGRQHPGALALGLLVLGLGFTRRRRAT